MCNAHRHSPGCSCGFGGQGQRYGRISFRSSSNWAQTAVREPWMIRKGLDDLNWDEKGVKKFLAEYSRLRRQELGEHTLAARLQEMLGWRVMEVEEEWTETLHVPLYRFSAPRAPGATVTYNETLERAWAAGWNVKVFGVGTGSTTDMMIDVNYSFVATQGQCMVIAVPVAMRVERIVVRDRGTVVGRGARAEVDLPKSRLERFLAKRVCRAVGAEECARHRDDPPEDTVEAQLGQEAPHHVQRLTKRWRSGSEREFRLGLKRVVEVGPQIRVVRRRELSLDFALPGGHDYHGNLCRGRLWWERPT